MSLEPLAADTLARVEDASLNASAPPQQRWLDGWLVRFNPGKAKRARSVNAVAPGRLPVAEKLALAAELYREVGLPLVLRITPFSQPASLDAQLAQMGMGTLDDTAVMVAALTPRASLAEPLPPGSELCAVGAGEYARTVGELRGSPLAQQQAHAERLALSPVPYRGFVLRQDGQLLACGQYARESGLVGLYDVFTHPGQRNRGLARRLCAEMLRRAAAEGARIAYLQVERDNASARAAYERLGFADGYRYHYRTPDPGPA